jgi:Thrombospondin type 3 repeat
VQRTLVIAILSAALVPCASASAHFAGEAGHGPDPVTVDRGPEAPAPAGGSKGKPLAGAARERSSAIASAARLPTTWCGEERSSDDRDHELPNGEYRYHAIYAYASDSPSRFDAVASTIQTDAFQASALLESSYGRALRYDMGTSCGPQYLDVTALRLSHTTAELEALGSRHEGTVQAVTEALNDAGFAALTTTEWARARGPLSTSFVVWLDAPGPSGACGQATIYDDNRRSQDNANNTGGKLALVFRGQTGSFCGSNTVRHEISHNLGALSPAAPNAFDGAHCDDAYEDTMCYSSAPKMADGRRGLYYDYGNDDYWDPPAGQPLPWWTVNLSRFLCPDTTCNVPSSPTAEAASDADGDGVLDTADNCPNVANFDQANAYGEALGDACEAALAHKRPTLSLRARRSGKNWRLSLRARGSGRGVISVHCRRPRSPGRVSRVWSRHLALPSALRRTVRCNSRPVATLSSAAGAAKVRAPRLAAR